MVLLRHKEEETNTKKEPSHVLHPSVTGASVTKHVKMPFLTPSTLESRPLFSSPTLEISLAGQSVSVSLSQGSRTQGRAQNWV